MKDLIKIKNESGIPLIGCIAFGIIDRGTNLLQIRPTTVCNLNCPFCSTDAGVNSKWHDIDFEVDCDYILEELEKIIKVKGCSIEANIDSMGETSTYPKLVDLVKGIKNLKNIRKISMQTNGTGLNKGKIRELKEAGMNHINLSMHTLNREKAKILAGTESYDIEKIKNVAKEIAKSGIDLCITPVYLPNVNENDIAEIIRFAKSIDVSLGLQKYEIYRYSRKMKHAKMQNWWKFYRQLKEWEKKYNIKLIITAKDVGIKKCARINEVFNPNEIIYGIVKSSGWINGQMITVARERCISVNKCNSNINDKVKIRILETKNNIYVGDLAT